jgi:aldehyde dehydrogenase (NAD+)
MKWEYAPSLEGTSHIELKEQYDLFIDGQFVPSESKEYFETINPSTGDVLAKVAKAAEKDVGHAVNAAKKAYETVWKNTSPKERGKYLFRIARLLQERAREFAIIESLDTGKPIKESKDFDIPLAAQHFFYYAGWADKLEYAFPGRKFESIGLVGQIIPWNFPLLMAAWKIAPALACGNTVVLKTAETSPLTAYKLAELLQDAGLPDGVVNILSGFGDAGEAIVRHDEVKKIAFTGSTEVGKKIHALCVTSNKKCTLELGGKSANIVLEDAPIEEAVEGIVKGIFFNQGHVCCAGSRLLVQESIADTFITKLKKRVDQLIVGNPLDKNTDIGAIHSEQQWNKIHHYIQIGKEEGTEIYESSKLLPEDGWYCKPTLFINATQSNRITQEEIFGPVLAIQTFRTVDEAIQKANNTAYGLAAGIWTTNGARMLQLNKALKAGVIWGNTYNKFDPASAFGGVKESGYGREGGIHGLEAYLNFID